MDNIDDIVHKLSAYIAEEFLDQPRKLTPDEPLISSGLIDSFSMINVALFVERTFGVRLVDTELNADHFDSIRQLAALIQSRQ